MERLTTVLLPLVALLVGLILGQQMARPLTIPDPTSDKLTPYQRGQLITQCYQARMDNIGTIATGLVITPCLEAVAKLP